MSHQFPTYDEIIAEAKTRTLNISNLPAKPRVISKQPQPYEILYWAKNKKKAGQPLYENTK